MSRTYFTQPPSSPVIALAPSVHMQETFLMSTFCCMKCFATVSARPMPLALVTSLMPQKTVSKARPRSSRKYRIIRFWFSTSVDSSIISPSAGDLRASSLILSRMTVAIAPSMSRPITWLQ